MKPTDDSNFDPIAQAAADWWARLRDPHAATDAVEQWRAWIETDSRHLPAFEQACAVAERARMLDAGARQSLIREFAPAAARSRRPLWIAAAAAVALAVGAAGWLARHRTASPAPLVYASAVAQNRDFVLPDDTAVTLGGASTLKVRFSANERRIELAAGEAFFRISSDPQRPFVVDAGALSVRDIGTAFDVRRSGDCIAVAVTQGRVRVASREAGANAFVQAVEAQAGQRVSWNPATRALRIDTVTPDQVTAWQRDELEFVDEPLDVVIANVNRYRARPLRIDDAGLARLTFTGTVRTDAIEPWLRALPTVFPLSVQESANVTVLTVR